MVRLFLHWIRVDEVGKEYWTMEASWKFAWSVAEYLLLHSSSAHRLKSENLLSTAALDMKLWTNKIKTYIWEKFTAIVAVLLARSTWAWADQADTSANPWIWSRSTRSWRMLIAGVKYQIWVYEQKASLHECDQKIESSCYISSTHWLVLIRLYDIICLIDKTQHSKKTKTIKKF